jgi:hypothetical protein
MADLTRDELDRLLASYAASGSTGWIVDIARMARASLDMVPAADVAAHGAALFERTISRRARRWEAFGRRVWRQYGAICAAMTRHHEDAERAWLEHVEWMRKERDEARRELGEVREVLAKVEWSGYQEEGHSECPCCYARARNGHRATAPSPPH